MSAGANDSNLKIALLNLRLQFGRQSSGLAPAELAVHSSAVTANQNVLMARLRGGGARSPAH